MTDEVVETEVPEVESPEVETEVVEEEYVPSYSYKVLDEEREFDERLQAIIKSKEDEDYIRDIVTRSEGLDGYKSKLTEKEQYIADIEGKTKALTGGYEKLRTLRDEGEMRKLMESLGIDDDKVLEYAISLAQENELPEEQKTLVATNRELERKISDYESRLGRFEASQENAQMERDLNELDTLMASEDYAPIVKAMTDKGVDFADEVVMVGRHEFQQTQKEPSVRSVVEKVAARNQYLLATTTEQPVTEKPVIPGVKSGGSTAVDKPIKSLDDLKKLASMVESSR